MQEDRVKTVVKGLSIVSLAAGVSLMASGCKMMGSCGKGSCGDGSCKSKTSEKGEASCGKGSCG
jgi:hypothetical protein